MATEVGSAYVSILPSALGFGPAVAAQIVGPTQAAGLAAGTAGGTSLASGLFTAVRGVGASLAGWLGFASIGIAAFKAAESVEGAMNIIKRATGATGESAAALEESFKKIAMTSPAGFNTIATALAEVSQRTGLTGAALESLTKQIVTFNRISKDSPIIVQDLTQALAGFNVPADQMGAQLDKLFNISQKTGVPLADLTQTLITAGPIARQFGWSVDFTAGFLAQLNKQGIETTSIMPGLRRAFIQFAKDGREPAAALQETIGQIEAFIKAGDLAAARNMAVQLFGARGVGLVDAAVAGKFSLEALNETIDATGLGIAGTAAETGTFAGKLGVLKNQATLALDAFGSPFLEAITNAFADLTPITATLASAMAKLAPIIVPVVEVMLAMKAASLLLAGGQMVLAGVMSLVTVNLSTFAMTAETAAVATTSAAVTMQAAVPLVGAFTAAFLATTQALKWLFPHVDRLTPELNNVETALREVSTASGTDVVNAFNRLVGATASLITAGGNATRHTIEMGATYKAFKDVVESNVGAAQRLAAQFQDQPAIYKRMQEIIAEHIAARQQERADMDASTAAISGVTDAIANLASTINGTLPTASGIISETASALSGMGQALDPATIQTKFAETIAASAAFFANLKEIFAAGYVDLAGVIAQSGPVAGGQLAASIAQGIRDGQPEVAAELNSQTLTIKNQNQELVDWTTNTLGPALFGANAGAISQAAAGVNSTAPQVGSAALAGGQAASDQWTAGLSGIPANTSTAVASAGPNVTASADEIARLQAFGGGQQIGLSLVDGIASGIAHGEYRGTAQSAIRSLVNAIISAANAAAGIASPSKVFAEMGEFMIAGLAEGLEDGVPEVVRAAERVVAAAALEHGRGIPTFLGGTHTPGSGIGPITVNVHGVADPALARAAGEQAGRGIMDALTRRNLHVAAVVG